MTQHWPCVLSPWSRGTEQQVFYSWVAISWPLDLKTSLNGTSYRVTHINNGWLMIIGWTLGTYAHPIQRWSTHQPQGQCSKVSGNCRRFGQGSSEPEQNVLTPFPKFTSARTMLAFVVSTCNETLAPSTLEGSTKVRTVPVGSRKLQVTRICLLGA